MFTLPKTAAGKYQVRVKHFAQDANRASRASSWLA
jgi:hypothetical protein